MNTTAVVKENKLPEPEEKSWKQRYLALEKAHKKLLNDYLNQKKAKKAAQILLAESQSALKVANNELNYKDKKISVLRDSNTKYLGEIDSYQRAMKRMKENSNAS